MIGPGAVLLALAATTVILILTLMWRPAVTRDRGGRILAFVALFPLPVFIGALGSMDHLQRSTSTRFCVSCHVMDPFGESLELDQPYLAASHYQNNRVPRDRACYSCHTNYTMYGDLASKWRGLRHVYVNYLGDTPEPAEVRLYTPYHNRECLYCHAGASSFEEFPVHSPPEMRTSLEENETSCLLCHTVAHGVKEQ
jgi:cytochrome c-type protein NapC